MVMVQVSYGYGYTRESGRVGSCSFIRYKNLSRTFFRFVTVHAFDGQTDGRTAFSWIDHLHSMQHSNNWRKFGNFRMYCMLPCSRLSNYYVDTCIFVQFILGRRCLNTLTPATPRYTYSLGTMLVCITGRGWLQDARWSPSLWSYVTCWQCYLSDAQQLVQWYGVLLRCRGIQRVRQQWDVGHRPLSHSLCLAVHSTKYLASSWLFRVCIADDWMCCICIASSADCFKHRSSIRYLSKKIREF